MPRFLTVAVACWALAACESSPTLPTAAEGPPPFSRITWDWTTLSPAPGSSFAAGQRLTYRADAFFEISPEDLEENPNQVALLFLEARGTFEDWTGVHWTENGDLDRARVPLPEGVSSGFIGIRGDVTVPATAPDCSAYTQLRLRARVVRAAEKDTLDSEKSGPGSEILLPYSVTGAADASGPCVTYDTRMDEYDWFWGEPVQVEIHNANPSQNIVYALGDDVKRSFILGIQADPYYDEVAYATTYLPVGSEGGDLKVYVDGALATPGAGLWSHYRIPEPRDFGDPSNDRWDNPTQDPYWLYWFGTPYAFIGRELAFTPLDRQPDPTLNPFGMEGYGRGDWWSVFVNTGQIRQMCVLLQHPTGSGDQADLFLTTSRGELLPAERYPGEDVQWLIMSVPSGPQIFYVWAAPKKINSQWGRYWLTVAECSWFGSPEAERMSKSRSSRDPVVPPGVKR